MSTVTADDYETLPWETVESTNIRRVAWEGAKGTTRSEAPDDDETGVLWVEFHTGRAYSYADVPYGVHRELLDAESAGRYFAANVRNDFEYESVQVRAR